MKVGTNRIAVKVDKSEKTTAGGLILTDESAEHIIAEVVGVCDNWNDVQCYPLQAGDKVIFAKGKGEEVKINGEDYLFLLYNEVLIKL